MISLIAVKSLVRAKEGTKQEGPRTVLAAADFFFLSHPIVSSFSAPRPCVHMCNNAP